MVRLAETSSAMILKYTPIGEKNQIFIEIFGLHLLFKKWAWTLGLNTKETRFFPHYFFGWSEFLYFTNSAADDVDRTFCPKKNETLRNAIICFRINISNLSWISLFLSRFEELLFNMLNRTWVIYLFIVKSELTNSITKTLFKYKLENRCFPPKLSMFCFVHFINSMTLVCSKVT